MDKKKQSEKDKKLSPQVRLSKIARAIMSSIVIGNLESAEKGGEITAKDVDVFNVRIPIMKDGVNKVKEGMKIFMGVDVSDDFVQSAVSHCVQTCFSMVMQFGMMSFYVKEDMSDENRAEFSQGIQNIIDDFDFCPRPSDPVEPPPDLKDDWQ